MTFHKVRSRVGGFFGKNWAVEVFDAEKMFELIRRNILFFKVPSNWTTVDMKFDSESSDVNIKVYFFG